MSEPRRDKTNRPLPPIGTRPLLAVYVVWHPAFAGGAKLALALYNHFRRDLFENVTGGAGLPVYYRSALDGTDTLPRPIDTDSSETTAIVMLIEDHWIRDAAWVEWARELEGLANASGLTVLTFPVAVERAAVSHLKTNAIRWDQWSHSALEARVLRLTTDLAYQFSRMLRLFLAHQATSLSNREQLLNYMQRVQLFLSHSKHDANGVRVAQAIRTAVHDGDGLASFFDVHDIPPGLPFDEVILESVRESAVVAVHSDSYSSREWCRKEVLQAKKYCVPLVVASCIDNCDERAFPYLGNVPLVRLDPDNIDHVHAVIGRLVDEVLRDFLWRCWTALVRAYSTSKDRFLSRPPEVLSLAHLGPRRGKCFLIYPEPPLSVDETTLFASIDANVQLRSMIEWIAERGS